MDKKLIKKVASKKVASKKVNKNIDVASELKTATFYPDFVTREVFDAHIIDMNNHTDARFMALNQKLKSRTEYQGWLVSNDFTKRCVAIAGYSLVINVFAFVVIALFALIVR